MGLFKKTKKFFKGGSSNFQAIATDLGHGDFGGSATNVAAFTLPVRTPLRNKVLRAGGREETSPGVFLTKKAIAEQEKSLDFTSEQLQLQANITADNKLAQDEERKRRGRRNNILTKPLGALSSNGSVTRVLTGQ